MARWRHLDRHSAGGEIASVSEAEAIWAIEPAGNEPLVLLLRDKEKPEIYLQKFIVSP